MSGFHDIDGLEQQIVGLGGFELGCGVKVGSEAAGVPNFSTSSGIVSSMISSIMARTASRFSSSAGQRMVPSTCLIGSAPVRCRASIASATSRNRRAASIDRLIGLAFAPWPWQQRDHPWCARQSRRAGCRLRVDRGWACLDPGGTPSRARSSDGLQAQVTEVSYRGSLTTHRTPLARADRHPVPGEHLSPPSARLGSGF